MSEQAISVRWASADFKRSDRKSEPGYRITIGVALGANVDQQCISDMQRPLSAELAARLGLQLTGVSFGLRELGPDGALAGLVFVAPASVFDIAPLAFQRAIVDALNQSMEAALRQHADDEAARTNWLAAVRNLG